MCIFKTLDNYYPERLKENHLIYSSCFYIVKFKPENCYIETGYTHSTLLFRSTFFSRSLTKQPIFDSGLLF